MSPLRFRSRMIRLPHMGSYADIVMSEAAEAGVYAVPSIGGMH